MEAALDSLCRVLEEELERQELVLRLCIAQEEAVQRRDHVMLTRRTEALNAVLQEVALAQPARIAAAREVVAALGLSEGDASLGNIIALAPAPYARRLAEAQAALKTTMQESSGVTRRNARVLRRMLAKTNGTLSAIYGPDRVEGGYNTSGQQDSSVQGAALLNRMG